MTHFVKPKIPPYGTGFNSLSTRTDRRTFTNWYADKNRLGEGRQG